MQAVGRVKALAPRYRDDAGGRKRSKYKKR
jgi:hypothetical protein